MMLNPFLRTARSAQGTLAGPLVARSFFLGCFGVMTVWGSQASAQDDNVFQRLDQNRDGFVTKDEVGEEQMRLFERLLRSSDKNQDGKLSKEEFQTGTTRAPESPNARPEQAGRGPSLEELKQIFDRMDANKDGKLTEQEIPDDRREGFKRALSQLGGGEGGVTLEQFAKLMTAMRGRDGGRPEGRPNPQGFRPPLITALDADGNGELSSEEIANASKSLLSLDKNGDGKISGNELFAATGANPNNPQGRPAPAEGGFRRLRETFDKNDDGKISRDEAPEFLKRAFDRLDSNSDGQLDEEEIRAVAGRLRPDGDK